MSEWNFTDYASKDNLLRTVRMQSDDMFALASSPDVWEAPTAAGHWQVRDVVGHMVDTTEGYFASWDFANGSGTAPDPLGVRGMDKWVDEGAMSFRGASQEEMLARLERDRAQMFTLMEALDEHAWGGFMVPHKYMGPLPAFFYPVAQLVDYTVHSWDIRQGSGACHVMDGDSADLLVPFCFIVWQSTADCEGVEPFQLGIRLTGNNGGETRASVSGEGLALEPGPVDDLPLVLEFDPASFVLTVMGRVNGGTARGDTRLADRFSNLFFRI